MFASMDGSGTNSNGTTLLVVIGVGSHVPPGAATLVTPQPLAISILPGTLEWSSDEQAVAFLVAKQGQNAGTRASLCVLDLLQATKAKAGSWSPA